MATKKRYKLPLALVCSLAVLLALTVYYLVSPWGFYTKVSPEEARMRTALVKEAESWLGRQEADGSHQEIIDLYNAHEPLAMGYAVTYTDSWCATFVSTAAIRQGYTDIIPTECSCGRQIERFQALGRWEERDNWIPLPGDIIYYDWDDKGLGDCTGWPEHVGIVAGTKWPFLKVIEGNKDDSVSCRYLLLGGRYIRGFGLPAFAAKAENIP